MPKVTSGTVISTFKSTHVYTEDEVKVFQRKKNLEMKNKNNKLSKVRPIEALIINDRPRQ